MIKTFREQSYYVWLMLLGVAISLLWVFLIDTQPVSDFAYYHSVAQEVASGGEWGNTYTTIGYSLFLAFFYFIFGDQLIVAKLLNVGLYVGSSFCLYLILSKITISEEAKKTVVTLFVLFPSNICYNSMLATEPLFTCLLLWITYLYFSEGKYRFLWMGLFMGIEILIKQQVILFALLIFCVEVIDKREFWPAVRKSATVGMIALVVICPFIYRNTVMMGQFTTVANNGGIVMYINNNSQNTEGRWMPAEKIENSLVLTSEYQAANFTQKNKMLSQKAKEWIVEHPTQFFMLGLKRLFNTYVIADDIAYSLTGVTIAPLLFEIAKAVNIAIKAVLFIPALLYIIFFSCKMMSSLLTKQPMGNKFTIYAVGLFYMFSVVYFVSEGQGRYSFPITFVMLYFFYEAMTVAVAVAGRNCIENSSQRSTI